MPEIVKALYILSTSFQYAEFVPPDCGPAFAAQYDWKSGFPEDLDRLRPTAVILDSHLTTADLETVEKYLDQQKNVFTIVQALDPGWYMRDKPICTFARHRALKGRFGLLSPYTPAGWWAHLLCMYPAIPFIMAPYLYFSGNEVPVNHKNRLRRIVISGNVGRPDYPLRATADHQRKFNPVVALILRRLPHPGYCFASKKSAHATYISALAKYQYAFVCSSQYKLEFLKYREIAYAGCVPCGELPPSLWHCPTDAFLPWRRNMLNTVQTVLTSRESERNAEAFREFMRKERNPEEWRTRVRQTVQKLFESQ